MSTFFFRRKKEPKPFNEELFKKVRKILSEQLLIDEAKITPDSRIMEDLGADSLNIVELVLDLEEAFNIEIFDEDTEKIQTVKELTEYIKTRIAEKRFS